jgi:hypothetical protein
MSKQSELNSYIRQLHQRLRLGASLRGVAILTAAALITTTLLVLILNAFAFPARSLSGARGALFIVLAAIAAFCLVVPLLRLNRLRSIARAEAAHPEFQQRLLTFHERERAGNEPFLELLAADTLAVTQNASPETLIPGNRMFALAGAGIACVAVLIWMIAAGPGYLGYGASLLWTGPQRQPLYDIQVTPGDVAVRRHSDQLITAHVIGLKPEKARLFAKYESAQSKSGRDSGWEPVAMQPQPNSSGAAAFQFLFTGLPEDVEYYVEAGSITSRHYKVRVVDLPAVKQIQATYHYPKWTGMKPVTEEHSGDLRAIEGTDAELELQMDRPLQDGSLILDNGQQLHLTGGVDHRYKGTIHMEKDGAYHVAATSQGQQVRLSEDYFIATNKANPPEIAIDRPGRDYRASPIEEVTVGVKASDEFGLHNVTLHYSVNGGPDQSVNLLKQPGTKNADGSMILRLEGYKLLPGDLVSFYATAKDGHSEARTDITFIQADPFEREFSQSQQSGGGGGGGQGQSNQTDISKREKELIAATWKQQNDKTATSKDASDAGKFLSDVQSKLRDQVLALSTRMQSRDLSSANEEFNSFQRDMVEAANAMAPSSEKLKQMQWRDAIPIEQKALQYLLRAEATFRQIQVAFGQRGGSAGGGETGRDLASLFDLELDTEKNQYETAQTGSPEEQRAKQVDDVLQKLDALARRQEDLAQQQHNTSQTFEQRWQQEMLRREAEQLQRQIEQMTRNGQPQDGQQSASSSGSSSSAQSGQTNSSKSQSGSSQSQTQSRAQNGGSTDPRIQQALNRLRQANDVMKQGAGQQQGQDTARRAAQQLRQATDLLSGIQQQQASGKMDSLANEANRLSKEEKAQADRLRNLASQGDASNEQGGGLTQEQIMAKIQDRNKLASERQQLSDDLSRLEKGLRDAEHELGPNQPGAASKLRDALSGMDQSDLNNRVQRTADWLRRGINPNSNGTEDEISTGLQHLSDQVRQAQQGIDESKPSQGPTQGERTAALDHLERLRNQLDSLTRNRSASGRQPERQGQNAQQAAQSGQLTRGGGQQGQPALGANQLAGNRYGVGQDDRGDLGGRSGDVGNGGSGGGATGPVWGNINTGDNHFDKTRHPAPPDNSGVPLDSERAFQNGLNELSQLRQLAQKDPAQLKEVQDLIREMQRLDPRRFPGNPALVEQLHTQVLSSVDRLELQLRRDGEDPVSQARSGKSLPIPPGYQDAVADYFRRLSKNP